MKEISYLMSRKDVKEIAEVRKINFSLTRPFSKIVKGEVQIWPWHGLTIGKRTI